MDQTPARRYANRMHKPLPDVTRQTLPIQDLHQWERNPRTITPKALAGLKKSIEAFGIVQEVVVNHRKDGSYRIVGGHQRVKALQELGETDVAVAVVQLSDAEEAALNVALNSQAITGDFDPDGLQSILHDYVEDIGPMFDDLVLDDLYFPPIEDPPLVGQSEDPEEPPESADEDDEIPEAPAAEPTTKAGERVELGRHVLHCGDCIEVMREMEAESADAIVTDPPYGLSPDGRARTFDDIESERNVSTKARKGFMGKTWDAGCPGITWAEQALRVLKPGGHLVAFGGTRTIHRLTVALEDAGFEIRDQIAWLQYQGMPKSLNVSKAIDAAAGAERETVRSPMGSTGNKYAKGLGDGRPWMSKAAEQGYHEHAGEEPATEDAKRWDGWGTALKPSIEPAVLARKPLIGTVANNVLEHGTGALNVDAGRYACGDSAWPGPSGQVQDMQGSRRGGSSGLGSVLSGSVVANAPSELGRWPANVYHCPKPARSERNAGLTGQNVLCSCKHGGDAWASEGQNQSIVSARAPSPGPGTTDSTETGDLSLPIGGSGSKRTGQSQPGTTSTTRTSTGSTTGLTTSSSSTRSRTSEYTVAAGLSTGTGGSLAASVASGSRSGPKTGTSQRKGGRSTGGVARAISESSSRQSVCDACGLRPQEFARHATVKPVRLMRWLVRLVTPPGGTVLEPFAGSGTTLVAAEREGFTCIGIEREPEYCDIIRARLTHALQPHGNRAEPRDGDRLQARRRVNYLVESGKIPPPNDLPCIDCKHVCTPDDPTRHEYDHHRGYDAEHHEHVEAVCAPCHHARTGK